MLRITKNLYLLCISISLFSFSYALSNPLDALTETGIYFLDKYEVSINPNGKIITPLEATCFIYPDKKECSHEFFLFLGDKNLSIKIFWEAGQWDTDHFYLDTSKENIFYFQKGNYTIKKIMKSDNVFFEEKEIKDENTNETERYIYPVAVGYSDISLKTLKKDYIKDNILVDPTMSSCGIINASGEYLLTSDIISSGNCIIINSNNVLFNGQGHTINYSSSGVTGYGIYINGTGSKPLYNITIMNTIIKESVSTGSNKHAVYSYSGNNITFINNTFLANYGSGSYCARIMGGSNAFFIGNNFLNIATPTSTYSVYLESVVNISLLDNFMKTGVGNTVHNLYISGSAGIISIINNTLITEGTQGATTNLFITGIPLNARIEIHKNNLSAKHRNIYISSFAKTNITENILYRNETFSVGSLGLLSLLSNGQEAYIENNNFSGIEDNIPIDLSQVTNATTIFKINNNYFNNKSIILYENVKNLDIDLTNLSNVKEIIFINASNIKINSSSYFLDKDIMLFNSLNISLTNIYFNSRTNIYLGLTNKTNIEGNIFNTSTIYATPRTIIVLINSNENRIFNNSFFLTPSRSLSPLYVVSSRYNDISYNKFNSTGSISGAPTFVYIYAPSSFNNFSFNSFYVPAINIYNTGTNGFFYNNSLISTTTSAGEDYADNSTWINNYITSTAYCLRTSISNQGFKYFFNNTFNCGGWGLRIDSGGRNYTSYRNTFLRQFLFIYTVRNITSIEDKVDTLNGNINFLITGTDAAHSINDVLIKDLVVFVRNESVKNSSRMLISSRCISCNITLINATYFVNDTQRTEIITNTYSAFGGNGTFKHYFYSDVEARNNENNLIKDVYLNISNSTNLIISKIFNETTREILLRHIVNSSNNTILFNNYTFTASKNNTILLNNTLLDGNIKIVFIFNESNGEIIDFCVYSGSGNWFFPCNCSIINKRYNFNGNNVTINGSGNFIMINSTLENYKYLKVYGLDNENICNMRLQNESKI